MNPCFAANKSVFANLNLPSSINNLPLLAKYKPVTVKKIYFFFLLQSLFFNLPSSFGQGGTWTWISGDSAVNAVGVYGTQGVPSINNHPPGMYEPAEWKDKQGNFWIYGGTYPSMSDLWKFNPVTLEWTWVKGNGQAGDVPVFGTQGISSPSNTPGQRTYCAATWVDASGMFWLFGGDLASNDLWKYDINTNEWTRMKGDSIRGPSVYGTQGIPSPSNTPGKSEEECSAWTDSLNNLWLLGSENYNDLWRFDISTLEWTWMNGSPFISPANYGGQGVANSSNDPGSRYSYTKWKDLKGNFWLMGGVTDINSYGLNDVWKYDLNINEWTWMSGPDTIEDPGSYQSNCIFSTINWPYSRFEQRSSVTDNCGRFWLFGGSNNSSQVVLNDLWVFDSQLLKWNWISGTNDTNQTGNYGNLGLPSPGNMPSCRFGAVAWWGNDNRFYMFGGLRNGQSGNCYSDVWVFNPDTNCVPVCGAVAVVPPVADFQSNITTLCANDCINFTNLSTNATSWQWSFAGALDSTSTAQNPQSVCYAAAGIYSVALIATNAGGRDSVTFINYINVKAAPPTPDIKQHHDTLYCSTDPSYTSYQWYLDSNLISGATNTSLAITVSGNYNVQVSNENGCKIAVGINIVLGIQNYSNNNVLTLSPNPAADQLTLKSSSLQGRSTVAIINVLGQQLLSITFERSEDMIINIKTFSAGIYFVQLANENRRWTGKFVKE